MPWRRMGEGWVVSGRKIVRGSRGEVAVGSGWVRWIVKVGYCGCMLLAEGVYWRGDRAGEGPSRDQRIDKLGSRSRCLCSSRHRRRGCSIRSIGIWLVLRGRGRGPVLCGKGG